MQPEPMVQCNNAYTEHQTSSSYRGHCKYYDIWFKHPINLGMVYFGIFHIISAFGLCGIICSMRKTFIVLDDQQCRSLLLHQHFEPFFRRRLNTYTGIESQQLSLNCFWTRIKLHPEKRNSLQLFTVQAKCFHHFSFESHATRQIS